MDITGLAVHEQDRTRIVLSQFVETTIARTTTGMFSTEENEKHAADIVRAVNVLPELIKALEEAKHYIVVSGAHHPGGVVAIINNALVAAKG